MCRLVWRPLLVLSPLRSLRIQGSWILASPLEPGLEQKNGRRIKGSGAIQASLLLYRLAGSRWVPMPWTASPFMYAAQQSERASQSWKFPRRPSCPFWPPTNSLPEFKRSLDRISRRLGRIMSAFHPLQNYLRSAFDPSCCNGLSPKGSWISAPTFCRGIPPERSDLRGLLDLGRLPPRDARY
jgi:hypothetical protein